MDRSMLGLGVWKIKRYVFALVGDMATAGQIVKSAAGVHVGIRNFDRAERLVAAALAEKPSMVLLDFEKCEAEAFCVLNEWRQSADLRSIPAFGFVTQGKVMTRPEAEKAGCSRVYMKTEFGRELPDLIARHAV